MKLLRATGLLCLALFLPTLAAAETAASAAGQALTPPKEGVNYSRLPVAIGTRDPGKVEVVEVFSYACIHCKTFQPMVDGWLSRQAKDVDFYQLPAVFDPLWARMAQAFYTAEALGVTAQVHDLIFSGIHDNHTNLADPIQLAILFRDAAGIDTDTFNQVYNSFSVRSRVQQADARVRAYRVMGTPTMIVAGKFLVDAKMAGGNPEMLAVVDYLVEQERAATATADAAAGQPRAE